MDLVNDRTSNKNDLLEKRFIGHILREEADELHQLQQSLMSSRGFTSTEVYNARGFRVLEDHKLQYKHPVVMRFIDMKTRTNQDGNTNKKKSHPIHNKPLFGMINNVLRRLQFEYTDRMKSMLSKKYDIKI